MPIFHPITDSQQILAHLGELYRDQPQIYITIGAHANLPVNRLIYEPLRPADLLLKVSEEINKAPSRVDINYTLRGKPHCFIGEVVTCRSLGAGGAIFKVRLPELIGVLNRREHLRIQPPESMPVTLSWPLASRKIFSSAVQDISGGGLCFQVPVGSLSLDRSTKITMRVNLPGDHIVPATIIIRHLAPEREMIRVGAEFCSLSQVGRQTICDYIIQATLGLDRPSLSSDGQLPTVCVIGQGVDDDDDLVQLESPYRLIRHELSADWKHLVKVEPDIILFCNLGSLQPERFIPKVKALPNLNTSPSVLITDEPKLNTGLDAVIVPSGADPASLIEVMERSIIERHRENGRLPEVVATADPVGCIDVKERSTIELGLENESLPMDSHGADSDSKTILVLNQQRRIALKTVCRIRSRDYRPIVLPNQGQFLSYLTENCPVMMVMAAASARVLKPLLNELAANADLSAVPRVLVVDPPEGIDTTKLSQPFHLSESTFLLFKHLPEADLADQLLSVLEPT
jgi:hypothetical protein